MNTYAKPSQPYFKQKDIKQRLQLQQKKLRHVEKLPFNLIIVDDEKAIWGGFQPKNEKTQTLWTNDPTQIVILKTSFERLWKKSSKTRNQDSHTFLVED